MFGYFPHNDGRGIANIVERSLGGTADDEERYGVQMDEFTDLIDEEDWFDASDMNGPDPAIEEELKGYVPYCTIPLDPEAGTNKANKSKVTGKAPKSQGKNKTCADTPEQRQQEDIQQGLREGSELVINQMSYNMFRPGYTIILYGPRRSGKSKLIKNLCQRMRHLFPEVIVFTMTKSSAEYFSYIPYNRVIEGLDEELLEKLFLHQQKVKEAMSRGEDVGNQNLLIIIDDCMAEGLRYKKQFNKLFYNGRHANITLMVAVQDVRGIAPSATINADRVCTFSLPDKRGRDTVREKFADYLTADEFDNLYDSPLINKKYHIVSFDIAHRYNPLNARISFGCVDEASEEPFVMGDRKMWMECPQSRKQLEDLGFGYMADREDWGIVQPRHVSKKDDAKRKANTKRADK